MVCVSMGVNEGRAGIQQGLPSTLIILLREKLEPRAGVWPRETLRIQVLPPPLPSVPSPETGRLAGQACHSLAGPRLALPAHLSIVRGPTHLFECGFHQVGWEHVPGKRVSN